ncbi:hypothetical protein B9Q01_02080 [Candidatus Marsarchaeota G1 archaeon OSP_D]|uniref:Uncharacterized protein n=2 Tax=Candidatus Marsarchaeota group 1 TaxID=2203770 RepID=A0A2R6ACK9_9ARCH|nr:MAG: hypothetical protein B9Q01_02080 [Candidatus Marsarchaeota G1 archaeon OSP_D]PSN89094.1 MAG: hypothetical protein B9Q00_02930 [Candidatus Marsarchaeota G1 archaeon OSP_C]
MYKEKLIKSIHELFSALKSLEVDEGIRVHCRYDGKECYAFITKPCEKFTVVVHTKKEDGAPGDRVFFSEKLDYDEIKTLLKSWTKEGFKAYRY